MGAHVSGELGVDSALVKAPVVPLEDDIRWHRLTRAGFVCATCRETHVGLFDLGCDAPEPWPEAPTVEPNSALVGRSHVLTQDFCIVEGRDYFIRCVCRLPIVGAAEDEYLAYGVWSTLSPRNFEVYRDTFDSGEQEGLGPWFGWFSNRLKGYPDTLNMKCQVKPRAGRQRPFLELESTAHPLAVEQRDGISLDRLLEIFALNGHDLGFSRA